MTNKENAIIENLCKKYYSFDIENDITLQEQAIQDFSELFKNKSVFNHISDFIINKKTFSNNKSLQIALLLFYAQLADDQKQNFIEDQIIILLKNENPTIVIYALKALFNIKKFHNLQKLKKVEIKNRYYDYDLKDYIKKQELI